MFAYKGLFWSVVVYNRLKDYKDAESDEIRWKGCCYDELLTFTESYLRENYVVGVCGCSEVRGFEVQ